MTEQWGAPLTGAQMEILRTAGLHDYVMVQCSYANLSHTDRADYWNYNSDGTYFLPADHPAYILLNAGWLDGRNVRLWFGGETAPNDWDGGDVLVNDTHPRIVKGDVVDQHNWSGNKQRAKIIAYIIKEWVDVTETPVDDRQPVLTLGDRHQPETVTIAKMTEAEAKRLYPHLDLNTLKDLRLIKETTREERFWALHEPEGTTVPTHIKKWVKDALEFER